MSTPERKSVGNEIYDDASSFGRFWAKFIFVIAVIMGIILIVGGIYILAGKNISSDHYVAKIESIYPDPCPYVAGDKNDYQCNVTVIYNDGTPKKQKIWYKGNMQPTIGDNINIYKRDNRFSMDASPSKSTGVLMIVVGVIIPLIAYFIVYMTKRNKFFAGAVGVGGALDLVRAI